MSSWTCPFCNRPTTITNSDLMNKIIDLHELHKNYNYAARKTVALRLIAIRCPNTTCNETTIKVEQCYASVDSYDQFKEDTLSSPTKTWDLAPSANIKSFPEYIPEVLIKDYQEAATILTLSPKASATLSRRCLQGMIRDFWKISKSRLKDEIDALEDLIDPTTWEAIDAIRKIGNIGAHMEKDINVIVDVDENEAETLVHLIEILFSEWYIARFDREQKKKRVLEIALAKSGSKAKT